MIHTVISVWQTMGAGIAILVLFFLLFWFADNQVHESLRNRFASFLLGKSNSHTCAAMTSFLSSAYCSVFGDRVWTWKFFSRSFLASITSLVFMVGVYFILNPHELTNEELPKNIAVFAVFGAILNLFPDCISLAETRIVIRKMENKPIPIVVLLLLLDLAFTTIIIISSCFVLLLSISSLVDYEIGYERVFGLIVEGLSLNSRDSDGAAFGVFIYTTYLTSVWIWLYMMSVLLMRSEGIMKPLRYILPIHERPFRAVGIVAFIPPIVLAVILREAL